eukprot:CAMPEP_0178461150 /NCGR_PEP_ID=MMETSP0689_2-20121128/49137_1 /TAXON_ID=160604 /ORGANISM="Amphidinium massartii, Strain CS-259" /LENGTH=87 /DNA_ID=CAMNT_0020087929 /DNA_START=78 /DNA_END=341 /DNA_ORIENTATION=-
MIRCDHSNRAWITLGLVVLIGEPTRRAWSTELRQLSSLKAAKDVGTWFTYASPTSAARLKRCRTQYVTPFQHALKRKKGITKGFNEA